MAPESLTDPDSVDARADLYALGAVVYFLLAGHPVFSGNLVQVLGHHLHTKPERLTERGAKCAPEFEAVVQRCLEKDPDARFQSAAELRSALLACAGGTWTQAAAARGGNLSEPLSRLAGSARKCLPISPWLGLRSR